MTHRPALVRSTLSRRTRSAGPLAACAVLALTLVGCSGGSDATADTPTTTSTEQTDASGDRAGGQDAARGGQGTSGLIASLTDGLMQVQGTDSQTAVSVSEETTVTQTLAATAADVTVGSCVLVMGGVADDDSTEAATAATSVVVSAAVDGECTGLGGFGGGGSFGGGERPDGASDGEAPADMPTDMPEDMPTDMPDGEGGAGGGFGSFTSGLVTAVDAGSVTVETTTQDGTATTTIVALDDTTTYTVTREADTSALAVGLCAQVTGEADSSGTVAATSVALSEAGDDGCSTRGAGGQGRPSGGGGPSSSVTPNVVN